MQRGRFLWIFLAMLGVAFSRPPAVASVPGDDSGAPHDFHVTYGRMGVEGSVIQVRLRFFQDDLALALRRFSDDPELALAPDPQTDSLLTAYLSGRFMVRTGRSPRDSDPISGTIVSSGEEIDGNEHMWWYVVQYEAMQPIEHLLVDSRLLLDLFSDQRNILRIQHFPSQKERTYYLTEGSSEAEFDV